MFHDYVKIMKESGIDIREPVRCTTVHPNVMNRFGPQRKSVNDHQ